MSQEQVLEQEEIVSAPVVSQESELPEIPEGSKVLSISELLNNGAEEGAVYLNEEQLKKFNNKETVEKPVEPVVENGFDESKWLKEKTGGQFEKWEDVWQKASVEPKVEIADETSKTIYEYLQKGEVDKVAEFLVLQKTLSGAEQAGDEDVIKMKMQIQEPDLDDVDLAFELDYQKPNEDEMDADAYKKAKFKYDRDLKKAANEARSFLAERKAELKLPPLSQPKDNSDFEQNIKEGMKDIHEAVKDGLGKLTDFEIKFANDKGIKGDYKYSFTDKEKKNVSEALTDYGQYFENRYSTNGGGYDGVKLAKDVLLLDNFQQIMEVAITDAIMKERLNLINESAGYSTSREVQPTKIDVVAEQEKKNIQRLFES